MKNKPTEAGYYAWRSEGFSLHPCICLIYEGLDEVMMVDFHLNERTPHAALEACADREWFKVEGL